MWSRGILSSQFFIYLESFFGFRFIDHMFDEYSILKKKIVFEFQKNKTDSTVQCDEIVTLFGKILNEPGSWTKVQPKGRARYLGSKTSYNFGMG